MPASARNGPPGPPAQILVGDVSAGDAPALELVRVARGVYRADLQLPRGEQGPPGPAAVPFEHDQASPATIWIVAHGLGVLPSSIEVLGTDGSRLISAVYHDSVDQLTVTHTVAIAGKVLVSP